MKFKKKNPSTEMISKMKNIWKRQDLNILDFFHFEKCKENGEDMIKHD